MAERSKTKQAQLNAAINEQAQKYIGGELLRIVESALDGVCDCRVDDDPFVIDINYHAAFSDDYLRSEVRLEIGPLASWLPYEVYDPKTRRLATHPRRDTKYRV